MTPAATLKREQAKAEREKWELALAQQLKAAKLKFERQFKAIHGRQFAFDFRVGTSCTPYYSILVEIHGGIWLAKGAHNTGPAITRDCEKACAAAIYGWRVMPVTGEQVKSGQALEWIRRALG